MTSLIMPSDYGMEMLVGSSPVLGSGFLGGSPYFSGHLWSHTRTSTSCSAESATTITAKGCTTAAVLGFTVPVTAVSMAPTPSSDFGGFRRSGSKRRSLRVDDERRRKLATIVPPNIQNLKSCLVSKAEELAKNQGAVSPTKEKKKVSFADMIGLTLAQIKIITERPDCPPRWSPDFLEQVTGGAKPEALPDQWKFTFAQPASDYLGYKSRLESNSVALENVILRDSESLISGTIKVRNMSFHKLVVVRYTTDNWQTYEDAEATFVSIPSSGSTYNIYDTFTFSFPLPSSSSTDKIEFCISYETDGCTFWDNNNDKNYTLIAFKSKPSSKTQNTPKPREVCDVSMDAWSEFSAWNNLSVNDSPYW